ncbi:MAG: tetratricopeptide repeat protein [Actinobacteria bacterium]|nr:tetratricopeptide repeat protein [Actinomycetota bacterium]
MASRRKLTRNKLTNVGSKVFIALAVIILAIAVGLTVYLIGNKHGIEKKPVKVTAKEADTAKERGIEFYRQGKWDEAIEELKKAIAGNPKDIYAQFQLAYAYEQKGQLDNAYKRYQEILKINKDSADAHNSIGNILIQKKELDKAITEFETAVKLKTDFTGALANLANAYVQKKEFEKALATYDRLAEIIKSDNYYLSRIHSAKGSIYTQMDKATKAKAEFAKALELDENNKEATAGLK